MADAWTILTNNSILGAGHDAWEHLLAQESGGETIVYLDRYISDTELSFSMSSGELIFSMDSDELAFVATPALLFSLENNELIFTAEPADLDIVATPVKLDFTQTC